MKWIQPFNLQETLICHWYEWLLVEHTRSRLNISVPDNYFPMSRTSSRTSWGISNIFMKFCLPLRHLPQLLDELLASAGATSSTIWVTGAFPYADWSSNFLTHFLIWSCQISLTFYFPLSFDPSFLTNGFFLL